MSLSKIRVIIKVSLEAAEIDIILLLKTFLIHLGRKLHKSHLNIVFKKRIQMKKKIKNN